MNVNKNHIREIAVTCSKYTRPFRGGGGGGGGHLAGKAKKGSKKSATAKQCSLQASSIMYLLSVY